MRHRDGFTIIELMIVVVIIGILALIAIPNLISMQARAKEAGVTEAAHTVQLSAEDYAVMHEGVYSDQGADLMPLFPGGQLLRNTFTDVLSEPQFGAAAATPGQVGIVGTVQGGAMVGYTITGWGKDQQILSFINGS